MSFREKSAWIMSVALLLGGWFYLSVVSQMSAALGHLAPPNVPIVVKYSLLLVALAVIGHIVAAAVSPRDATAPVDERERLILDRAGNLSGNLLGVAVLVSLGHYLYWQDGNLLFYCVFASLLISQLAEYALQIMLYRGVL